MIRTRFSPSPTGLIHLGNVRTALFSALYATHMHGAFILRIEDTDIQRSEHQYTTLLQDDLMWLGIQWQEGPDIGGPHTPYWQSQRHSIYEQYYQTLETLGRTYPCFCTDQELALNRKVQLSRGQAPRYPGTCRKLSIEEIHQRLKQGLQPAIRFNVPEKIMIEFIDIVKGPQKFNSDDIGDFIIRRADGSSSFMFCNAIDDSVMEVTHVLRGEDHLTNTPRQLMILQALKMRIPQYGHLSLITGDDGTPLSKRHGSFSLQDLRHTGFLSLAILNYLARLGHTYEQQVLLSFSELAKDFDINKLSRGSARFDKNQLLHWQKEAVLALDHITAWTWLGQDLQTRVPIQSQDLFIDVMRKNILFPNDAHQWAHILFGESLHFSNTHLTYLENAGEPFFVAALQAAAQHGDHLKNILHEIKTTLNVSGKNLFLPIRIALTGKEQGPELDQIAALLGKEKIHTRFQDALNALRKVSC